MADNLPEPKLIRFFEKILICYEYLAKCWRIIRNEKAITILSWLLIVASCKLLL